MVLFCVFVDVDVAASGNATFSSVGIVASNPVAATLDFTCGWPNGDVLSVSPGTNVTTTVPPFNNATSTLTTAIPVTPGSTDGVGVVSLAVDPLLMQVRM